MVKLEFKIVEIPEGASERTLELEGEDLDLDSYPFLGGKITLSFFRTIHFIRVNFAIEADVELVCDRSLRQFVYPVEAEYEVLFKVDLQEETENENGALRRFNFSSNSLNIEEEVRDTILLRIPIKKLHPDFLDDEGNPRDFDTKSFGETDDENGKEESFDPRWEELKKLKKD